MNEGGRFEEEIVAKLRKTEPPRASGALDSAVMGEYRATFGGQAGRQGGVALWLFAAAACALAGVLWFTFYGNKANVPPQTKNGGRHQFAVDDEPERKQEQSEDEFKPIGNGLLARLVLDKETYKVGDRLAATLELKNTTDQELVFFHALDSQSMGVLWLEAGGGCVQTVKDEDITRHVGRKTDADFITIPARQTAKLKVPFGGFTGYIHEEDEVTCVKNGGGLARLSGQLIEVQDDYTFNILATFTLWKDFTVGEALPTPDDKLVKQGYVQVAEQVYARAVWDKEEYKVGDAPVVSVEIKNATKDTILFNHCLHDDDHHFFYLVTFDNVPFDFEDFNKTEQNISHGPEDEKSIPAGQSERFLIHAAEARSALRDQSVIYRFSKPFEGGISVVYFFRSEFAPVPAGVFDGSFVLTTKVSVRE